MAIEIDLHPVSTLYGGTLRFAPDQTATALHAWARWSPTLPDTTSTSVLLVGGGATIRVAHAGPAEEGARLVQALRDRGPVADTVTEMPYAAVGTIHDEPTEPVPFHARNTVLTGLPDAAVEALLQPAGPDTKAGHLVEVRLLGGALGRPGPVPARSDDATGPTCSTQGASPKSPTASRCSATSTT